MTDSAELLALGANWGVVRVLGRWFPGMWIPADTFSTWLEVLEVPELEPEDLAHLATELRQRLDLYQREMQGRGERLPFVARSADGNCE